MVNGSDYQDDVASLEDYLDAIRRRKWLIALVTALGLLAAAYYVSTRTATYEAEAQVLVGPTPVGQIDARLVVPNLDRERLILLSVGNAENAVQLLDDPTTPAQILSGAAVTFQPDSEVLILRSTRTAPRTAALQANALTEAYVQTREADSTGYYDVQLEDLAGVEAELVSQLEEVRADLNEVGSARAQQVIANDGEANEATRDFDLALADLNRTRAVMEASLRAAQQEARQLELELSVRPPAAKVLRTAEPPGSPTGISSALLYAAGLLGGLVAGVIAAFVLTRLDRTAHTEEDIQFALGSSVLATVPRYRRGRSLGPATVVMASDSSGKKANRAREEYRRLRSTIRFLQAQDDIRSIAITSTSPAEGKSVTTANLGVALAKAGLSTVLVSADLRKPTLEAIFRIRNEFGLSDWLETGGDLATITSPLPTENLYLINAGEPPPNPAELLSGPRFASLVDALHVAYDVVLVDTPPVLSAADALSIVQLVDGTIFVVDASRADLDMLERARRRLDQVGARILGAVKNRDRSAGSTAYHGDGYYTSSRPTRSRALTRTQ